MALYLGATVLYVYFFLNKNRQLSWYATFLTGAGFIMQTISIVARWISTGQFPISGTFNSLLLASWGIVLVYFVVEHLIKIKTFGPLLVPIAFVLMAIAQLTGSQYMPHSGEVLDNWRVWFHVILIMLANAGFAIAAAAAGLYLLQERQIKRHKTNIVFRRLPSLAQADRLEKVAIEWAYPAYTAGIFLGILRAISLAPEDPSLAGWYLDPRVMLAGIIWVVYGVYLILRFRGNLSARQAAWLTIAGFIVVVITAVVARTVASGFHIFGVI